MTRFDPSYLWAPIHGVCPKCDYYRNTPLRGFIHDVRCWSWRTAFYNVWCRIELVFGLIELALDDDTEWFGNMEW